MKKIPLYKGRIPVRGSTTYKQDCIDLFAYNDKITKGISKQVKQMERKKINWVMLGIIFAPILIAACAMWLIGLPF